MKHSGLQVQPTREVKANTASLVNMVYDKHAHATHTASVKYRILYGLVD